MDNNVGKKRGPPELRRQETFVWAFFTDQRIHFDLMAKFQKARKWFLREKNGRKA